MVKKYVFMVLTNNPDLQTAAVEAATALKTYMNPNANFEIVYNDDNSKALIGVLAGSEDWYETSNWYNHPAIVDVYTLDDTDPYKSIMTDLTDDQLNNGWSETQEDV